MKKLFVLIAAAAFIAPATVFAQDPTVTRTEDDNTITIVEETPTANGRIVTTTVMEKNSVFTNGFWHNWQLNAGIGTQMYYGDNDWKVAKKVPEMFVFPTVDLYLTKWVSPSFGVGLGANWAPFKGLYQTQPFHSDQPRAINSNFRPDKVEYYTNADPKYDSQKLALQKGSYLDVFALAHANLMNIFGGYKPDRFFEMDLYAGGGVIFGFSESGNAPSATFNTGLINTFRLTEQLRLMLNLRGALVGDDFDGEAYVDEPTKKHWSANHKLDGIAGATLGLAWNIGKEHSKWRLAERTSVYQYDKEVVEKIVKEQVQPSEEKIVYVNETPEVWFHINFVVDRWEISKKELINIHAVADLIKSTPNTKYLVCGYADKQTATPAHNLMLSENRAKVVYDALVNEFGVDPNQLVTDYKGGVDYMFYNMKELSRCTMITSIKE